MNNDQYFLEVVKELRRLVDAKDPYLIFRISDLLYKLLLDSPSLVDVTNREKRLKVVYKINNKKPLDFHDLSFWSIEDGIDPDTAVSFRLNPIAVNKSRFLKQVVMISNGREIQTRDLIRYVRNISGGVHRGNPKKEKEFVLYNLQQTLFIGGLPTGLRLLRAIARVVLKGLTELELASESKVNSVN